MRRKEGVKLRGGKGKGSGKGKKSATRAQGVGMPALNTCNVIVRRTEIDMSNYE